MNSNLLQYCKGKNIYCYGAGFYGRITYAYLRAHGVKVTAFVVTYPSNAEENTLAPLLGIDEVVFDGGDGFVVAVAKESVNEIVATLQRHGIFSYYVIQQECADEWEQALSYPERTKIYHPVNVLLYHRVIELPLDTWKLAVTPKQFEKHVRFLKNNYCILRFEDDWSDIKERSVVLTFDDGYVDFFQYVLPILEKYAVYATVFISTENIDTDEEFWWDCLERILLCNENLPKALEFQGKIFSLKQDYERQIACYELRNTLKDMTTIPRQRMLRFLKNMLHADNIPSRTTHRTLSSKEIAALVKSDYVTIGGHTVTHTNLAVETEDTQRFEIQKSKEILESITGRRITTFSYPFGGKMDYTKKTTKIVQECGYEKAAVAYGNIRMSNVMEIPRHNIQDCTTGELHNLLKRAWFLYG